jgi:hypothetical protein
MEQVGDPRCQGSNVMRPLFTILSPYSLRLTVVSTYRVSAHYINILQLELVYTSDYAHPQDFRTDTRRSWLTVLVSKLLRRSAFSSAGSGGKYAMLTFCSHTTDSSSR